MTIRKVLRAGHPDLRTSSDTLPESRIGSDFVSRLLDDMFETMADFDGVGLAAPQVQETVKLLVYEIEPNPRYTKIEESTGPNVLINPDIVDASDDLTIDWEGCLSLPDLRGEVPRHEWIEISALNRHGESIQRKVDGFEARVIQHEIDHLNGQLFVDRMNGMESLSFLDEYKQYQKSTGSEE